MNEGNLIAIENLDRLFTVFSVVREDGATFPKTFREFKIAQKLLKKAEEAEPEHPEILVRMEYAKSILVQSPKERVWVGSRWIIVLFSIFLLSSLFYAYPVIKDFINAPSSSDLELKSLSNIKLHEEKLSKLLSIAKPSPTEEAKTRKLKNQLAQLRYKHEKKAYLDGIQEKFSSIIFPSIQFFYAISLLAFYVYSAKCPRFLSFRREIEKKQIENGLSNFFKIWIRLPQYFFKFGNLAGKSKYWLGQYETNLLGQHKRDLFGMKNFKKEYELVHIDGEYYKKDFAGKMEKIKKYPLIGFKGYEVYEEEAGFFMGWIAIGFWLFAISLFFAFFNVAFFLLIIIFYGSWVFVLALYLENYHYEKLDNIKMAIKEKMKQGKVKTGKRTIC